MKNVKLSHAERAVESALLKGEYRPVSKPEFDAIVQGIARRKKDARSKNMNTSERLLSVLKKAKEVAREYRELTGKPLGITGEVAEYEASRKLRIPLAPARNAGWDAVENRNGISRKLQIKGRVIFESSKPGQRLGRIQIKKDWDAVLMVILDKNFDAVEIWEAGRKPIVAALTAPGSRSRIERGALGVRKFKSIGKLRWQRDAA